MRRLQLSGLQFILALVLSLALWTFVSFTENPAQELPFEVPLTLTEPPAGLIVVDPDTGLPLSQPIDIVIEAAVPQQDLGTTNEESFAAIADISDLEAGEHTVRISVREPRAVTVRRYQPSSITVRLVPQATKTLPVEATLRNRPGFLFNAGDVALGAADATATGPEALMDQVVRISAPVDLQGRTASFTSDVELLAVNADGEIVPGITITPPQTRVTVEVAPRVNVQRVSVVPRFTGQAAPGYKSEGIDWNPKFVELIAPLEITGTLETAPIDLTGRTESFTETVQLNIDDPSITLVSPNEVTVTVPIEPFQIPSLGSVFVPVRPTGVAPDLQTTLQPAGVTLTLQGTADQFKQLESNPVQATVNLSGYGPGQFTVPVSLEVPGGLQIVGPRPQVSVTISPLASPSPASTPGG